MKSFCVRSGQLLVRTICFLTMLAAAGDVAMARPANDHSGLHHARRALDSARGQFHQLNSGALYRKKRNLEALARIFKRSSDTVFTKRAYSLFYSKLFTFIMLIKPKLTSRSVRDNIETAIRILPTDSSAFTQDESELLITKIRLTSDLTDRILENVKRFLLPNDNLWFDQQKNVLDFAKSPLLMALAIQNVNEDENLVDRVTAGVGSLNTSDNLKRIDLKILIDINALIRALES